MFRFMIFTSVLLISFSANAAPEFNPARNADMQMKGVDINKNGTAELKEYLRLSELMFVRMDANSDHSVSPKELADARFGKIKKITEEKKLKIANKMIDAMDKDKNHLLSKDEFQQPTRDDFNRTDMNHDMIVTRQEMTANWKRKMAELKALMKKQK